MARDSSSSCTVAWHTGDNTFYKSRQAVKSDKNCEVQLARKLLSCMCIFCRKKTLNIHISFCQSFKSPDRDVNVARELLHVTITICSFLKKVMSKLFLMITFPWSIFIQKVLFKPENCFQTVCIND